MNEAIYPKRPTFQETKTDPEFLRKAMEKALANVTLRNAPYMNLIALQKLLQKWNEEAEKCRVCRNYTAAIAYTNCANDLGFVIQQITMTTQPHDTTP